VAKVTMPQLGESVAEGTIGKWLKKPGDTVEKYEALVEVITDKVNAEVPSPFAGILKEILVEEGATVPNNAEIAIIETADEGEGATDEPAAAGTGPTTTSPGSDAAPTPAPAPAAETAAPDDKPVPAAAAAPAAPSAPIANGPAGSDERPERAAASAAPAAPTAVADELPGNADARMTPAVRRLLREHGLTAAQIVGSGGGGRITREDVTNYVETQRTGQSVGGQALDGAGSPAAATAAPASAAAPSAPAPAAAPATAPSAAPPASGGRPAAPSAVPSVSFPDGTDEVLIPMTQMRKGIAAQMTKALQAPHAYVQMEVDVTRLVAFREKSKRDYQAREGIGLSFVPFVVKASAEALKRHPTFNAHWT